MLEEIPQPIQQLVFSFLSRKTLQTVKQLNHHFYALAEGSLLAKLPNVTLFVRNDSAALLFSRVAGKANLSSEIKSEAKLKLKSGCRDENDLFLTFSTGNKEEKSFVEQYSVKPNFQKKKR